MSTASLPPSGRSAVHGTEYVLLAMLTLFWGVNWPLMKLVLAEMPVLTFRALCLTVGAAGLFAIAYFSGRTIAVPKSERLPLVFIALINVTGWHLFTALSLTLMPAGSGSIVAFTMPLWATLFARLVLHEAITLEKLAGLVLGMIGVVVLMGPQSLSLGTDLTGAGFMLCAAICWGLGTVLLKRFPSSLPTTSLTAWHLTVAATPIVLGAVLLDPPTDFTAVSQPVLWALAFNALIPMILCYWIWFRLVRALPAAVAAISTLAIPVVGVFSSAALLGEPIGLRQLTALVLVVSALALVLLVPNLRASNRAQA